MTELETRSDNVTDLFPRHDIIKRKGTGNGGGGMSGDYVTHKELELHTNVITSTFDKNIAEFKGDTDAQFAKINGKFDTFEAKIDNLSRIIWWGMGIIGSSVVAAVIKYLFFTK